MPEVHLQFTQDDRDMIRDTNHDVKQILGNMNGPYGLEARVNKLEAWQTRVMAICGAAGVVTGFAIKMLWR